MNQLGNYIHGRLTNGNSKESLSVYDPSTGEKIIKLINSNHLDFEENLEIKLLVGILMV